MHEQQLATEIVLRWVFMLGVLSLLLLVVLLNRTYRLNKRTNAELNMDDLANRDALTCALSRKVMVHVVEKAGHRFDRFGHPFRVVMIDGVAAPGD